MGISPTGIGKVVMDFFKPFLKMLPGNLYTSIEPAIAGTIGGLVGDVLDTALTRGFMIPLVGPYIGMFYFQATSSIQAWLNVDLRNFLTETHPATIVRSHLGAQ